MAETPTVEQLLTQRFPGHVLGAHAYRGDQTIVIAREGLLEIARFLRDDLSMAFDFLMDLSCVDYLKFGKSKGSAPRLTTPSPLPYFMTPKPVTETWQRLPALAAVPSTAQTGQVSADYRFEVVYHFYSSTHNHRVRVKVPLTAQEVDVDSLTGLWPAANWFEREVWDMFGIRFRGHPNLKRLLMYEPFEGHPLRKDYPVYKRQPLIGPQN